MTEQAVYLQLRSIVQSRLSRLLLSNGPSAALRYAREHHSRLTEQANLAAAVVTELEHAEQLQQSPHLSPQQIEQIGVLGA